MTKFDHMDVMAAPLWSVNDLFRTHSLGEFFVELAGCYIVLSLCLRGGADQEFLDFRPVAKGEFQSRSSPQFTLFIRIAPETVAGIARQNCFWIGDNLAGLTQWDLPVSAMPG